MSELTTAEALGTGLEFTQHWDVAVQAGSIGTISGLENLGKDLAFALLQAAADADVRGRRFTPELREDARIIVRDVVTSDSRIASIDSLTVTEPDDARATAEVQLTVVAITDERGAFVFTV